jgi:hypothetical protein
MNKDFILGYEACKRDVEMTIEAIDASQNDHPNKEYDEFSNVCKSLETNMEEGLKTYKTKQSCEAIEKDYEQGFNDCKELVIEIFHEVGLGLDDPDYDFVIRILRYVEKLKAKNTQKYNDFLKLQEAVITFKKEVNSIFSGHTPESIEKLDPYDFLLKHHLDRLNSEENEEVTEQEKKTSKKWYRGNEVLFSIKDVEQQNDIVKAIQQAKGESKFFEPIELIEFEPEEMPF